MNAGAERFGRILAFSHVIRCMITPALAEDLRSMIADFDRQMLALPYVDPTTFLQYGDRLDREIADLRALLAVVEALDEPPAERRPSDTDREIVGSIAGYFYAAAMRSAPGSQQ